MSIPVPNPDWAKLPLFDRKGWKRVRFGDVVENLNDTMRDPAEAGIKRFIGLEHLEPGSLHIRTWGNMADGTTFTRRCRPGQVLFGKRRAYQRKVAVAAFDAVVSGDIYVLTPKNDRLLPGLLPFLCMAERFFQHAVGTSAGSLSPRTNWSSLASFEFELPPLDQQRRMAEVLWGVDDTLQSWLMCDVYAHIAQETYSSQLFDVPIAKQQKRASTTTSATFHDSNVLVIDGDRGKQYPKEAEYTPDGHCLFLNAANVTKNGFVFQLNKFISTGRDALLGKGKLKRGDIIITTRGTIGNVAFYDDKVPFEHVRINSGMVIIRNNSVNLLTEYIYKFLASPITYRQLQSLSFGSAQKQLTVRLIEKLHIPIRSSEDQRMILQTLEESEANKESVMKQCRMLQDLLGAICEYFFKRI